MSPGRGDAERMYSLWRGVKRMSPRRGTLKGCTSGGEGLKG
jgi:hypothetical protein